MVPSKSVKKMNFGLVAIAERSALTPLVPLTAIMKVIGTNW